MIEATMVLQPAVRWKASTTWFGKVLMIQYGCSATLTTPANSNLCSTEVQSVWNSLWNREFF